MMNFGGCMILKLAMSDRRTKDEDEHREDFALTW